jgi:hypothetical protein
MLEMSAHPAGGCRGVPAMKGQVIELATHDVTIQRAIRRGLIEASFFPFEAGMAMWIETVKDMERMQLAALRIWYPWIRW